MRRSFKDNKFAWAGEYLLLFFVVVCGRAFQLQVVRGQELRGLGEAQQLKDTSLPKRGAYWTFRRLVAVSLVASPWARIHAGIEDKTGW